MCVPHSMEVCAQEVIEMLAYIALGKEATRDVTFYASISQFQDEAGREGMQMDNEEEHEGLSGFSTSYWTKIREGTKDSDDEEEVDKNSPVPEDDQDPVQLSLELDSVFNDLKMRVMEEDHQLQSGVRRFINRYKKKKESCSSALMASSFDCFGSLHGGNCDKHSRWWYQKRQMNSYAGNSFREMEAWD